MSKANQLLNIEIGTFKRQGKKLILELNHNQFRYDQLTELNELKQADSNFLQLVNVVEQDQKVVLTYTLPDKVRSLKELPHENKAIRSAIAKEIMSQDVVTDSQYHIALNPANLWYYPMQHVWYAYRANELMPYDDKHSNLAKYKALILFCLTGTPYERLLSNPKEALAKHPDEYLQQVAKATSLAELKEVVNSVEDFVSYHEWQVVEHDRQKNKQRLWLSVAGIAIVAVVAIGLVHKNDERKYQSLANQNQAQVTRLRYSGKIQTALNDKKWSEAQEAMKKAGYSSSKQAQTFLKHKQYQQALKVDPSQLNKIVNTAYVNKDSSQVADWQLPTKATSKQKDQLKLEKAIVNYDTNTLNNQLSFTTNADVLLRMGQAFLAHNDTQDAQTVQTKLAGVNSPKAKYLKALLSLNSAKNEVSDAQKKLDDANKIDGSKDKDKDKKVDSAKSDLKNAQSDQSAAQKQVDQAKQKVGD
ncbi:type VII secretion protein EssB/YukC [Levilactobacillus acidifarinae]|uniref:Membrane protein with 1 predicted TMS n=1 Tax=Levilactobacillus acidifarinae DSM 19394 = JCM 15949 TaxID=1423715 RepID=A0A0R1LKF9_9LACO|nr:type VII secretion protein EssB/YukC [Levilactobacillus acidifarinae]KRK96303.1 membrane protein with 1 predicted TMS [Levilactobacillus acidifarinae DSM 19394]GEO70750.1 conjugal transfer protein [Levilactobacillus acidifarinae]